MDVASVASSASPGITSQQSPEASRRIDQNDQLAKARSAQAENEKADAAAKAAQAAALQVTPPESAPKPVVNSRGQTIGSRISVTA